MNYENYDQTRESCILEAKQNLLFAAKVTWIWRSIKNGYAAKDSTTANNKKEILRNLRRFQP